MILEAAPKSVAGEIFNVGTEKGNYTKGEVVALVEKHVPNIEIQYKDLKFEGDMRDVKVSFEKIRKRIGFEPKISVEDGVIEVRDAIQQGVIGDPLGNKHRNAQFLVQ